MKQIANKSIYPMKPINIDEIRYKTDDYIAFCLGNEESLSFLKNKDLALFDVIEAFVFRKAKRIRPILLMFSFFGYAKKDNSTLIHAAVALELMHTFALIHDDIMDRSLTRDCVPTLHKAIDDLVSSRGQTLRGEEMAMLIGDLIYNIALEEFQKVTISKSAKIAGMEMLLSTALKTGHGQLLEQVRGVRTIAGTHEREMLDIYDLKTAAYTFCLPLEMGAMLAGKRTQEQKKLNNIGLKLGRAFQIIDDINDFSSDNPIFINFLSAVLWGKSNLSERKKLKKIYASSPRSKNDIEWLTGLYYKYDILKHATRTAFEFVDVALCELEKLAMESEVKEKLSDYIGSIMQFDTEC